MLTLECLTVDSQKTEMNACDPDYWQNCPPDAGSCYPAGTCDPDVNSCGPDYGGDCFPEVGCFPNGDI